MIPDEIRELEEHRADFRALQDRVERLAGLEPLSVDTDAMEELLGAGHEVEAWEQVIQQAAGRR